MADTPRFLDEDAAELAAIMQAVLKGTADDREQVREKLAAGKKSALIAQRWGRAAYFAELLGFYAKAASHAEATALYAEAAALYAKDGFFDHAYRVEQLSDPAGTTYKTLAEMQYALREKQARNGSEKA